MKDRYMIKALEVGLGLLGTLLVGGIGVLIAGRLGGAASETAGHGEAPPGVGTVPAERHANIAASSPR